MRRLSTVASLVLVVLVGLLAVGHLPGASAQDATPTSSARDATPAADDHPLVGAWVVIDISAPGDTPSVSTFTRDGTMGDAAADGAGAGAWEPTGPNSAAFTLVIPIGGEEFSGTVTIRGTIEMDEGGDNFNSPYSYTVVAADGTVVDAGQGEVEGTRIDVEPLEAEGTPLAAIPTWAVGTPPAATPTS